MRKLGPVLAVIGLALGAWALAGWWPGAGDTAATARNLVVITVDTLRADRLGAYGFSGARTPTIDRLSQEGARFARAYAPAPITLPSHATLFTGRNPPGHGARHNGMAVREDVPVLAERLKGAGFQTSAFIAAFPLDRRFGLARGFDIYDDQMGHAPDGRALDERPGAQVIDNAIAWLRQRSAAPFFVWVHLFEPHAPYGTPAGATPSPRPVSERYNDEIAEADRQTGRLIEALGTAAAETLIVFASDHGEAFGEHGEVAHSVFVYDTTLQVPLVMRGPGIAAGTVAEAPVGLIDIFPTALAKLGLAAGQSDGVDLSPALAGHPLPARSLYAESFAPLIDFGWAPLRALRRDRWKYIEAPTPELYDLAGDPAESRNVYASNVAVAQPLALDIDAISGPDLQAGSGRPGESESARRLGALGYLGGGRTAVGRPDPKERREQAARLARITSGELHGDALIAALRAALADDPGNPQAHMRLGFALRDKALCRDAEPHFTAAIAAGVPSADPFIGRASCEVERGDLAVARQTLERANEVEPGNAVVAANLGLVESAAGRHEVAITWFERAVRIDPGFHEARFNLVLAHARAGRRADAEREVRDLLGRLPADAPQRPEVERLLAAIAAGGRLDLIS
jgi:arylsulfatase A-like enzyme